MKAGRRHGFLCQSHASTAVCIPGDSRSVIVPRRPDRAITAKHPKLVDLKYTRLVQSHRFSTGAPVGCTVQKITAPSNAPNIVKRDTAAATVFSAAKEAFDASKPVVFPPHSEATSSGTTYGDVFQVVVMRVSIHCQGCACKVKKHISKMEGVTSFSIDLEKKRVTVMGHISPLGVLESVSKVKKAEFWQA